MKVYLFFLIFTSSFYAYANSRVVCFPGKVGVEKIDSLCFDRATLDPELTKIISVDEKGVATIQIQVRGSQQALTIYTTKETFTKKVTQE